jgi:hypothetical protein
MENTKMFSNRKRSGQLGGEEQYEEILRRRFKSLGYDDYGDDSDSGGGAVASNIISAAATLGSAYVASQNQNLTTQSPIAIRPAYATSTGSSSMLLIVVVIIVALVGVFAFSKA